jgi:DHA1 family tetracycline resistance protein-like MFS transporter
MFRRSPLLPIFLIVLVDVLGLTIVIPLMGPYAESLHATAFQATLPISIYAVCQLVSGPLLGRISDRTGRRPMLLVSQAGTFLGFLLMARAQTLWVLYVARAIDGSTAGNLSLAQAYISDKTEPKDRAKSFALIGIAFGLGYVVGPGITAWLSKTSLSTPIYAAAALSFTSICCTFFLLPNERPPAQARPVEGPGGTRLALLDWGAYVKFFRRPVLGGLLVQFLFYMFAFQTFISGFSLFAERTFRWHGAPFTPREIVFVMVYVGVLGTLLQGGAIGRLVARFGEGKVIVWGFASLVAGYFTLGFSHDLELLGVAMTASAFGTAVLRPSLTSLVTQHAGRDEQGVVLGLTQSLSSVAAISAPALAGLFIQQGWLGPWAWVGAAAAALGLAGVRWGSGRAPRVAA